MPDEPRIEIEPFEAPVTVSASELAEGTLAEAQPSLALTEQVTRGTRYQDELRSSQLRAILEAENNVLQESQQVSQAMLAFHEVEPDQVLPPKEWVEKYGQDAAEKRLRVARSGWLPSSAAPSAVKYAVQIMVGIAKSRGQIAAAAAMPAGDVNVRISLPSPTDAAHPAIDYPSKEID